MFIINGIYMKFNSYTETETYYEFLGDNGYKYIAPKVQVILVDEDDSITFKTIASRKTIGYLVK